MKTVESMVDELFKKTSLEDISKITLTDEEKLTNFETMTHIRSVQSNLAKCIIILEKRLIDHDKTKLEQPELDGFMKATPLLKKLTYGSEDYEKVRTGILGPALKHHYENFAHHPEHYENGIHGMNLIDVIEMFCDWSASAKRHDDGKFEDSIKINKKRFGYDDLFSELLLNTEKYLNDIQDE